VKKRIIAKSVPPIYHSLIRSHHKDKPARIADIASSSAMEWELKKACWLYTGDTKIVDISTDGEDSRVAKIEFVHRVRTLCTMYIVKSSKSTVVCCSASVHGLSLCPHLLDPQA
jgi:hypothetical protein